MIEHRKTGIHKIIVERAKVLQRQGEYFDSLFGDNTQS
jgi:hypothetical protein